MAMVNSNPSGSQPFKAEKLRITLEAVLAGDERPFPSMAEVARRLRYSRTHLTKLFPDLCRLISERHQRYQRARSEAGT